MNEMRPWTVRLIVFSLALGGLRDPRLFAAAGAAAWWAVWRERPALGPAAPWLPWLGWACASALLSAQPLAGLPVIARWAAVLGCASLAAAWNDEERADWLRSLFIVAVALALGALATGAGRGFRNNMTGLIPPYYNYTAFVLSAAAAAGAAWILHPRGPRGRDAWAPAALCVLALACVVLARSRGAWLGLGAAGFVWGRRRFGLRAAVAAAAFASILAAGLLRGELEGALLKKYRLHGEARPDIWRAAVLATRDRPWLGNGPGNFALGFRRHPAELKDGAARWPMSTNYAHSEPLQAAAETGWAGLLLWLFAAAAAGRSLLRGDEDPVREAAAAAAGAMTAQLLVDNMLHIPALAALWLCALAIASPPSRSARWPRAAAPIGAALALLSWIPGSLAARSPAAAAALFRFEPGPREDLANAAMAAGDGAAADVHWAAAQELEPFNAIYPWRRAQIAGARGEWDRAGSLAGRAIELEPGFVNARLLRAEALARAGRSPESRDEVADIRRLLASRPDIERGSGYERTVWAYDPRELQRVADLAGPPSR